ncbi:hybrid sensor histidine kinase/response regulator [Pedobacter mendelii]|uniref:histidine kinase n=1 Tax=Pedobacter mendelii TaxID=1908240 RepID=A0ABQ2BGG1_9SPHI|nr:hybrid sensor histidine kinase/response regulator [Pedobacter mendelii]GGI23591.1 histidine kinase [Pedobacter mendelii]
MKTLLIVTGFLFCFYSAKTQYIFKQKKLQEEISILQYASLADVGTKNLSIQQILTNKNKIKFKKQSGKLSSLGFTSNNYWLTFAIKNELSTPILYYLETAEPVTNNTNLYLINKNGKIQKQFNGDNLDFNMRTVVSRKTIFKIELDPGETKTAYIEIKNDGEKNNLPLRLISQEQLLKTTYTDQLVMGFFYGILSIIAITYFFFYFAIKERSFLYYAIYVIFVGLCQFALDGFYHQYIGKDNSWINRHAVIIFAILSCYFFGKYSEIILDLKVKNYTSYRLFRILYFLLALVLIGIIIIPDFLKYSYPIVNILTFVGMLLILMAIFFILKRKQSIDLFYTAGIAILFFCIILAILMNFGVFDDRFSIDNITKPGIALEIIALSLSMANRIRLLKTKEEELQFIALQKSQEMNDIKSYFLSNMSHELRTPLNVILGLAGVMENESKDSKFRANCEVIKYTSYGLISSINDILDFSKIEKGQIELEKSEFKPLEILSKLALGSKRQIEEKGLSFNFRTSLDSDTLVLGDPIRLQQIVYNVLGNAIKFTQNGEISFEIKFTLENDTLNLSIIISDTGVGIPTQKLESIFDLFSQTSLDNKRKFGGFGIGLSIVKSLVDLHKGKINIKSKLNEGTICEISINYPVIIKKERPLSIYSESDYDLFGKEILIVEDNPMNQMIIQMILEDWKNTVVSLANDGAECLELMKNKNFDLILMDLQMPVMDGYEAIMAIRNNKIGNNKINIPIIVITADITKETKDRVFMLGANDYMNKPIDDKLIYQKVTSALIG